jgi:lysophospholipase L1-like esterase
MLYNDDYALGSWSNYFANASRLDENGKYLGTTPTAIFNNLGINDGCTVATEKITKRIRAVRSASAIDTDIYLLLPFNCDTNPTSFINGYENYLATYPDDPRVYFISL